MMGEKPSSCLSVQAMSQFILKVRYPGSFGKRLIQLLPDMLLFEKQLLNRFSFCSCISSMFTNCNDCFLSVFHNSQVHQSTNSDSSLVFLQMYLNIWQTTSSLLKLSFVTHKLSHQQSFPFHQSCARLENSECIIMRFMFPCRGDQFLCSVPTVPECNTLQVALFAGQRWTARTRWQEPTGWMTWSMLLRSLTLPF